MGYKESAKSLIKWIENTTIEADKISAHFGIRGKEKLKIRELAKEIRGWCLYEGITE